MAYEDLRRQTLLSNIAGNLIAAGTRGPATSPAAALEQMRQNQLARKSQGLQNTLAMRQEDRLRMKQQMAKKAAEAEAARKEKITGALQTVAASPVGDGITGYDRYVAQQGLMMDDPKWAMKKMAEARKPMTAGEVAANTDRDARLDFDKEKYDKDSAYRAQVDQQQNALNQLDSQRKQLETQMKAQRLQWAEEDRGIKAAEKAETKAAGQERIATAATTVVQDTKRMIDILDTYGDMATGPASMVSSWLPVAPAGRLNQLIESVKGNIGIDTLLKIKASGSGLGQVPQKQLEMLAGVLGRLNPDMQTDDLRYNIERIENIYADIIEKNGGVDPNKGARGGVVTKGGWSMEPVQ